MTNRDHLLIALWENGNRVHCLDGLPWPRFQKLHDLTRIPVAEIRREFQEMRAEGLFYHTHAIDCDGIPNGSGYFPTLAGERLIEDTVNRLTPPAGGEKP
jgi:hypothetical protein